MTVARADLRVIATTRRTVTVSREDADGLTLELDAHNAEALAFTDDCAPLISALGRVVLELGPREYHLIRLLRRRHDLYRLRHEPPDVPLERAA